MAKIIQFEGKQFHEQCFDSFLKGERSKNKVVADWRPNTQILQESEVEASSACEECGNTLLARDSTVDTMNKNIVADDDEDDDKDTVTETPAPPHRRRR